MLAAEQRAPLDASLTAAVVQCPAEANSCGSVQSFPGTPGSSVIVGPVTNLGQDQSVYVQVAGLTTGDEVAVAFCSVGQDQPPVAEPNCASSIPPPPGCTTQSGGNCSNTASPLEWQYSIVASGQVTLSIGTELDPAGQGDDPIVSQTADEFVNDTNGSFFCDDGPDYCAIEVIDISSTEAGQAVIGNGYPPRPAFSSTPQNTEIFPLSWASTAGGCGSAPLLEVDTSYSAQQIIPAAAEATCNGTGGVAVLATALASTDDKGCTTGTGTNCPINDVAAGTVPVTFTDDPEDRHTLAELKKLGGKFAYIPIAVSATEIAFLGAAGIDVSGSTTEFPIDTYEMTPAMVAGVMTQLWNSPDAVVFSPNDDLCGRFSGSIGCDESIEKGSVTEPVEVKGEPQSEQLTYYEYPESDTYSNDSPVDFASDTAYALLDPWLPTLDNHPVSETRLGAMFPSTSSGATNQVTSWMCAAKRTSYSVVPLDSSTSTSVKDIMSAAQILANAEKAPTLYENGVANNFVTQSFSSPSKDCKAISKLPTNYASTGATSAALYEPSSSPLTAAHAMVGAITAYGGNGGMAFGAMDSSQADFYGLLPASLQNAAGTFVAPNQTSVDAALGDATTNADGTLTPDYNDKTGSGAAAAYPLPMVTYALVSTAPQPTAFQATQLSDLLTNLVDYSYAGGAGYSVPMPAGYFPLPANLYKEAVADIAADVVGPGGASTTTTTTTTTATPAPTPTPVPISSSQPVPNATVSGTPSSTAGIPAGATTQANGGSTTSSPPHHTNEGTGSPVLVTLGYERILLPMIWVVAILSMVGGSLLFVSPSLRRRLGPLVSWWRRLSAMAQGRD
jgi:hypothetical protein